MHLCHLVTLPLVLPACEFGSICSSLSFADIFSLPLAGEDLVPEPEDEAEKVPEAQPME